MSNKKAMTGAASWLSWVEYSAHSTQITSSLPWGSGVRVKRRGSRKDGQLLG